MKTLLSTTALALVLGFPTMALSQAPAPAADQNRAQQASTMSGFLDKRSQSDVFASELIGHDVYAGRTSDDMTRTNRKASNNAEKNADRNTRGTRGMDTMNRADLDNMDKIGQINEVVLSNDGQVRALVIGVGGFLGMGERDVAVTMDQVTFTSDADNRSEMYITLKTSADKLKNSPAYDRMSMKMDGSADNAEIRADRRTDRTAFAAPKITRDGYDRVEATQVSTDVLMGKSVYDVNDKDVGTVTDMIVDDAGTIKNVVIDFGGFLGMGESHVSMDFDELTIMSNKDHSDVRVYVDATKEQIQGRPQYHAKK
ncbi:MAG: PRC-barrel domain-containing protein [Rhodospirillales bacterium]